MREKPELRVAAENFEKPGGHGYRKQPDKRSHRNHAISSRAHATDDGSAYAQRYHRQQLICYAEQRPEAVNAAKRIYHSLVQEVSPARYDQRRAEYYAGIPTGTS